MKATVAVGVASLVGAVSAQDFRIYAQTYLGTPGEFWGPYQTYYGDGHMYVGPGAVPASLSNVLNYYIPDWLATSPDIRAAPLPPATEGDLPLDTFIALNNGTGAREPLVFSNDEAALGEDHVSRWLRWGTFAVPQAPDSADTSTTTHFYLEPTEEEQTFRVTWRTPGTPDGGLQRVNLTAQLPSAVPPPTN